MRLVSNYYIIGLFLGLLSSCAQIGTIEGGAKDENPPRVIKSSSENGTINFKEKKIEFVFDEYFQLNNPKNTVSITPNHTRLKTSSSAKKLQIEFLDSLQPNTTYQLILNSTVKDINEGNDSLMVFVFSTGTSLDSAYFQTKIVDAFNNQPLKKMYVGLFDSLGAEPTYLQKTNDQGRVSFSYVKSGSYKVKSWEDQNSSGKYDSTERVAFRKKVLELSDSIIDTIPLRLAQPEFDRIIRNIAVIEPGLIGVGLTKKETDFSFFFTENALLPESEIQWKGNDSLLLAYNAKANLSNKLYVKQNSLILDSARLETSGNEITSIKLKATTTWITSDSPITFELTDFISAIDEKKISCIDKSSKDTIKIESIEKIGNQLSLKFEKNSAKELEILFLKEAVAGKTNLKSDRLKTSISVFTSRELGVLKVDVSKLDQNDIIQLLQNGKVVQSKRRETNQTIDFKDLVPAEYSFRVIRDKNQNNRWDGWGLKTETEPEIVLWFSTPIKVRANWDIKTELVPKDE
jgi:uncharacterized protein (DUF2141 family)